MSTNIVLIDDHKLFREGIKRILEFEESFNVVAEASDGSEALAVIDENEPDVVIMDINMPDVNGVEATKQLIDQHGDLKVIILSIHDDESYVTHALKSGALGYMLKEMDTEELVNAIKVVSKGGSYIHPKVTHRLINEYRRLSNVGGESKKQHLSISNIVSPFIYLLAANAKFYN